MPGMTGADLARLACAEARRGLPVLIVSGYAEAEGIARPAAADQAVPQRRARRPAWRASCPPRRAMPRLEGAAKLDGKALKFAVGILHEHLGRLALGSCLGSEL